LSEQQHLIDEIANHKQELIILQDKKIILLQDIKQEQKTFADMQTKFQPRQDDLQRVLKLAKETKPPILSNRVSLLKDDWDFIVAIAKQHARISDTTLTALESQAEITEQLKRCQNLYLAVATEVAAITHLGDRERIKNRVADVLKDIEDWRYVAWVYDDMINRKPSSLDEILAVRETKIAKKHSFAKKVSDYNQPTIALKKTKKQSHNYDDR